MKVEYVMKNLTKKIMIFSMVGMMQIGFGAAVLEASPLHNDGSHRFVQFDDRHDEHDRDYWQHEHDERLHKENERYRHEMARRHHENRWEWHERQERERQQHEDNLRGIEALLIGIAIGSHE
jgi:hypothetical protein